MALLKSRRKDEMKKGRFVKGRQVFIKKIVDAEVTEVLLLAQAGGKPGSDWGTASLLWEWWDGWEGGHPCPCKATGGATAPCTQLRSTWVTALTGGRGAGLVISGEIRGHFKSKSPIYPYVHIVHLRHEMTALICFVQVMTKRYL